MSDGAVVGLVGADGGVESAIESAVDAAGGRVERGPATAVADSDFLVAVGEAALLSTARTVPDCPILPVDAGRGFRSVPAGEAGAAVETLLAGGASHERHPLVDVTVADRTSATAVMDVMLVTAQPAEISEYAVESGDEQVAQFRADGVVVATPGGSSGYARAAGGPVASPETGVEVVVPIAPFATDLDHWVLDLDPLALSVERGDADVSLLVDDREVGPVDPGEPVKLARANTFEVAVVEGSQPRFQRE